MWAPRYIPQKVTSFPALCNAISERFFITISELGISKYALHFPGKTLLRPTHLPRSARGWRLTATAGGEQLRRVF
jgi:hypothetical protein